MLAPYPGGKCILNTKKKIVTITTIKHVGSVPGGGVYFKYY